jgi:hypothetical protein
MFTGQVTKADIRGTNATFTLTPGGLRFDEVLPRLTRSPMCWATLFHDGCNLVKADWKCSAAVSGPVSSAYPYQVNLSMLAGVGASASTALGVSGAVFTNWFARGWIEWTPGGGGPTQRRSILANTAPSGSALTVTLDRWFNGSPSGGDSVVLYPGCDGQRFTCQAFNATTNPTGKFNNFVNFRGAPFTPPGNPAMIKRSSGNSGAKK